MLFHYTYSKEIHDESKQQNFFYFISLVVQKFLLFILRIYLIRYKQKFHIFSYMKLFRLIYPIDTPFIESYHPSNFYYK